MTDDVPMATRLRRWARADVWGGNGTAGPFLEEVADALDEKDAEIERLREVLRYCGKTYGADDNRLIHSDQDIRDKTRAALARRRR